MAIALVGAVASSADTAGDYTTNNGGANISGDDDFVEGTGAIGDKMSNTTELLVSDTLSGGTAGVYDFSVGGNEEGQVVIAWFNSKTPLNATSGIQSYFANASGHFGYRNNMPASFYKGGFITRAFDPRLDFTAATTWTLTGNPAQLDDVSELGFRITTITSIMGAFNNVQIDQITVGEGIRADAGTSGTPNTFESVRAHDEDTNFYGFWSSSNGQIVSKGKLFIGPATGTTASWFVDSGVSVVFAEELVDRDFYEFAIRGANTTCTWDLLNISAANPAPMGEQQAEAAGNGFFRWNLTVDSTVGTTTGGFTDTNSVWSGARNLVLNANSTLTGTTLIDCFQVTQNGATLEGLTFQEGAALEWFASTDIIEACVISDAPDLISDSQFNQRSTVDDDAQDSGGYRAIEIDTAGTYTFTGNTFPGFVNGSGRASWEFDSSTDVSSNTITLPSGHGYSDGDPVTYSKLLTANTAINGSGAGTQKYFTGNVTATTLTLHSTRAAAIAGTGALTLTATGGSETHAIYPWHAAIWNTSGGLVTINVGGGGDVPSFLNALDSSTVVNANTSITLTGMKDNTEVRVCAAGDPNTELAGIENATVGTTDDRSFTFSLSAATVVDIIIFNVNWILPPNNRIEGFTIPGTDASIPISQIRDRNFENP
jgi:hypothetical protein